jgi:hypothetical protein
VLERRLLDSIGAAPRLRVLPCKICGSDANLHGVIDFARSCLSNVYPQGLVGVPVYYRRCRECDLIFTSDLDSLTSEDWKAAVYNDYYHAELDKDYEYSRPASNARLVRAALKSFPRSAEGLNGLDYGGGNGFTAKLVDDKRMRFFSYDPYAFSNAPGSVRGKCDLISAFEVVEHTIDPLSTFADMAEWGAEKFLMIIGTQCHDGLVGKDGGLAWNYIAPRNGHVTIYSYASLRKIAEIFRLDCVRVSRGTHLLGRGLDLYRARRYILALKFRQRVFG